MKNQLFSKSCLAILISLLVFLPGMFFSSKVKTDDTPIPTIDTIAGGLGDGNLAVNLKLPDIFSLTSDNNGNLFLAQNTLFFSSNNIIRRIDNQTNVINTIAGLEALGRTGENPAQKLKISVSDMKTDPSGRFLYVASRSRIDLIEIATGNVTRYAGDGQPKTGNGDGGLATEAAIWPGQIQVDAQNNLFVFDFFSNSSIRRIDSQTGIIETVAGGGKIPISQADDKLSTDISFSSERVSFVLDKFGTIFFYTDDKIFKINPKTKIVSAIKFNKVDFTDDVSFGNAVIDSSGTVFFTAFLGEQLKAGYYAVLQLDSQNNLAIVAGNKKTSETLPDNVSLNDAFFGILTGLSIDSQNNIYVIDSLDTQDVIFRLDLTNNLITLVGGGLKNNGDGDLASKATFFFPTGIVTDNVGNIFISEFSESRIRRIDAETGIVTTYAGTGVAGFSGDRSFAKKATLKKPDGITLDKEGNLFIADRGNSRIRRVDRETKIITTVVGNPKGENISFKEEGDLLSLSEANIENVQSLAFGLNNSDLYLSTGTTIAKADFANNLLSIVLAQETERFYPTIATNKKDELLIAIEARFCDDSQEASSYLAKYNFSKSEFSRVNSFSTRGCIVYGVTTDNENNIFISNPEKYQINKVDPENGDLIPIAGIGKQGYSGDGGPASQASISYFVNAVTVDRFGNLYFTDSVNNAVRVIKGATKPIPIIIKNTQFQNQQLTISGKGYGNYGAKVFINGKDVSQNIVEQRNNVLNLTGTKKELGILKTNNKIQVKIGVGKSNTFDLFIAE